METILALIVIAAFAGFVIWSQDRQLDDLRMQNAELLDRCLEKNRLKPIMPPLAAEKAAPKASTQPPRGFASLEEADEILRDWVEEQVWSKIYQRNFKSDMERESEIKRQTQLALERYYEEYPDRRRDESLVDDESYQ